MKNSELHKRVEEALLAERPLRQAPPGFAERVLDALPSCAMLQQPRQSPRTAQRIWPRLALAGVLGLLAFAVWKGFAPKESGEPVIAHNPPARDKIMPAAGLNAVSLEQVQALTARIDQPLEKELERVMADTRSAIRFVASNFLPDQN